VFQQEKTQAEGLNDKAVEYEIVRQEAAQSRTLYENLFSRLKEADLVAGLRSSNITVVDPARIPLRPAKPNVPVYMAGSIAMGFLLAVCVALFRDATDYSIQEMAELGTFGREGAIGLLPYHPVRKYMPISRKPALSLSVFWEDPKNRIVAASEPRAAYTEALRTLRTALMFSNHEGHPPQVVLITSSIPGEGKSMLSINLAAVYAQHGKKVLLIDADLRTPILDLRLGLSISTGLSDLLASKSVDGIPNIPVRVPLEGGNFFDFIPAGPVPAYPSELLGSETMTKAIERWRRTYDHIFIDGAPLLPVTDSALMSSYADFTLIVARHKLTDKRSLEKTYNILQHQGVRNIGLVLNAVQASGEAQYRYYGYKPMAYPHQGGTDAA
jgi:polysaccharide biosynthesis transport protein